MRRTRLRRSNPERKARQYARNYAGPYEGYDHAEFVRSKSCAVVMFHRGCGYTDAAHVVKRGMGGARGTWRDLVPLCRTLHRIFEEDHYNDPALFAEVYDVDLEELARDLAEQADREHGA